MQSDALPPAGWAQLPGPGPPRVPGGVGRGPWVQQRCLGRGREAAQRAVTRPPSLAGSWNHIWRGCSQAICLDKHSSSQGSVVKAFRPHQVPGSHLEAPGGWPVLRSGPRSRRRWWGAAMFTKPAVCSARSLPQAAVCRPTQPTPR